MRKQKQEVYVAIDNQVFLTESECLIYENQIKFEVLLGFLNQFCDEDQEGYNAEEMTDLIINNIAEINVILDRF